jgi:hypothetical protein
MLFIHRIFIIFVISNATMELSAGFEIWYLARNVREATRLKAAVQKFPATVDLQEGLTGLLASFNGRAVQLRPYAEALTLDGLPSEGVANLKLHDGVQIRRQDDEVIWAVYKRRSYNIHGRIVCSNPMPGVLNWYAPDEIR